ncbi:ATP-dependent RNA helicase DHX36 [Holothuria leucospilota]|uniref:ATP-dependent RNA helicase DHX36 n=1 Tax=Holothuria leucospilota TaxID=206669 RepID=A0A9Q0YKQ4_HOLLE|nr:ATP-dependent RNA helicase DHX36 [Holothuria leucospilota]
MSGRGGSFRGSGRGRGNRGGGRGGGGGGRHPPGLKGAEIGMWYRNQSRGKKKQREISQRAVVSMNSQQASNISQLLDEVKVQEQEAAGPSTVSQVSSAWKAKCKIEGRVRDFYMSQLERKPSLDTFLMDDQKEKEESNVKYQEMQKFRKKLPSYSMKEKLTELINNNQVTVISGETGCGKTTQVPQFILDDYIARGQGSLCRVVCTQPRRISAISVS